MLIDSRELADGHRIEADVVIIGGGAAGIALACELADGRRTVALLEGGGLAPEPDVQNLYVGESVGLPAPDLTSSRLRFLGGTTAIWTGQCAPLDPVDFEARDGVPFSGWPISRADLDPFYERAGVYCELGPPAAFDAAAALARMGVAPLGFDPADFIPLVYQMSPPTRFGTAWRDTLIAAPGLDVFLHANAIEILPFENGAAIDSIRCGTLTGRRFSAHGARYILATGGIENARILLASNTVVQPGLGNDRDRVGRFFMDHFNVHDAGSIVFARPEAVDTRFHRFWTLDGLNGRGGLRIPGDRLRSERLLSSAIMLWPEVVHPHAREGDRAAGVDAFATIARSIAARDLPDDLADQTCVAVNDRRAVFRFAKDRLLTALRGDGGTARANLQMEAEQAPNADSRVTLSDARDPLGVPRARLDWRPSDVDYASIRRTLELFARAVGSASLGRYHGPLFEQPDALPTLTSTCHHMGTTRMSTSPADGVVDPDGRIHGIDNLYVAGSSVFPTSGRSNPTLTLIALAIRLADHLKQVRPA